MVNSLNLTITRSQLELLNVLKLPIWIVDIEQMQTWWANLAALSFWQASSIEELSKQNFFDCSEAIQKYLQEFNQGKTVVEQWTFYHKQRPVSIKCVCSSIRLESGQLALTS